MKSTKSKHDIEDNSRNLNLSNKQNNSRKKEKKNDKPTKEIVNKITCKVYKQ